MKPPQELLDILCDKINSEKQKNSCRNEIYRVVSRLAAKKGAEHEYATSVQYLSSQSAKLSADYFEDYCSRMDISMELLLSEFDKIIVNTNNPYVQKIKEILHKLDDSFLGDPYYLPNIDQFLDPHQPENYVKVIEYSYEYGADSEYKKCCHLISKHDTLLLGDYILTRRPTSTDLIECALESLGRLKKAVGDLHSKEINIISFALNSLNFTP